MPRLLSDYPDSYTPQRVLLVDQSDDCRDVIRTVLERRGMQILETSNAGAGLKMLREHRPHVVVLDADTEAADNPTVRTAYHRELAAIEGNMLVLGNIKRDDATSDQHQVWKPYHYGPLIERIEQLVGERNPSNPDGLAERT